MLLRGRKGWFGIIEEEFRGRVGVVSYCFFLTDIVLRTFALLLLYFSQTFSKIDSDD